MSETTGKAVHVSPGAFYLNEEIISPEFSKALEQAINRDFTRFMLRACEIKKRSQIRLRDAEALTDSISQIEKTLTQK